MEITLNQKTFRTPTRFSMGCQKKILQLQEKLKGADLSNLSVKDYEILQEMACVLLNDKPYEKRNPCLLTMWMLDEYGDDATWAVFLKEFVGGNDIEKKRIQVK